ncbi:cactin-like isoform X2 [Xenia sp. Carnegie-2017]|nr:cactin-like isoform X2 [Xenia sp. Carnegie-2017]
MKREEMKRELASVKRRRQEREHERMAREEERELMQREKEGAYYKEWEKQEDMFHIEQARMRSKIRIRDGRAKPIDLLAQYINPNEDNLEYQMHEPYSVLVGLSLDDLGDLIEDMKLYLEIDETKNHQFWKDMLAVTRNEEKKLQKQGFNSDQFHERRETINSSVNDDIEKIFRGKTSTQLSALRNQINEKISSGGAVDIGYWESLLQQLNVFMAKSRLRENHQKMLKEKLATLKRESVVHADSEENMAKDSEKETDVVCEQVDKKEERVNASNDENEIEENANEDDDVEKSNPDEADDRNVKEIVLTAEELMERGYKAYEDGRYSPPLIRVSDVDQEKLVDPEKDFMELENERERIMLSDSFTGVTSSISGIDMRTKEASKDMGADEETFNVPVPLGQKKYLWQDKYRPRKPRFFNRVHTGYEWNKYNQTHYDMDNPPPKIVQGYKFNIFYPDLIDKTETPQYYLEPCASEKDFAILRFNSGPPYEDIAFKVVNREWEYSHKHGFRSQFHNGVFQLWFHFKRYRYRR